MTNMLTAIRDIVVIVTGIAGLAFGLYRYRKSREAENAFQIELMPEVHTVTSKNVVSIAIQVKNVGKAAGYVMELKQALCSIRKVSYPNGNSQLHWDQMEELIHDMEYLSNWEGYYPKEPMIFEPGVTETYHIFFSTEYHGPIWIRAELVDQKDYKWQTNRLFVLP